MVEWFQERYISRDEHQQIVEYYRKLVAQLYCQVCELRATGVDAHAIDSIVEHSKRLAERDARRSRESSSGEQGNVISVDFRRRRADAKGEVRPRPEDALPDPTAPRDRQT